MVLFLHAWEAEQFISLLVRSVLPNCYRLVLLDIKITYRQDLQSRVSFITGSKKLKIKDARLHFADSLFFINQSGSISPNEIFNLVLTQLLGEEFALCMQYSS